MGGALARAAAKSIPGDGIYLYDRFLEKAEALAVSLGCHAGSLAEVSRCDYIFLGVKPQMMAEMLSELSPLLQGREERVTLVSMAAGVPMEKIQNFLGYPYPVIRIMPNMPVSVGAGMIQYTMTENVSEAQLTGFLQCMTHAGVLDQLPEALIDAGTAVASCGPAFAFLFIEALTRGGVRAGLPEEKAELYAKQMLLGAAKLSLCSPETPAFLREAVCSPGGSTIEGVKVMQDSGFPEITEEAVLASYRRNIELGK